MQFVIFTFFVFSLALVSLVRQTRQLPPDVEPRESSDVTYYFYNQVYADKGEVLKSPQTTNKVPTIFDSKKKIFFIIHGWADKYNSESVNLIRTALLKTHDINVIVVDWSPVADNLYLLAKNGVPKIGKALGNFVQNLTSIYDIPLSEIAMVGHSLGAHVAGIAGNILNGKVDHIIGLDPARPFVNASDTDYILDSKDAKFVQIIHTSSGKLSLRESTGHADYFPNGGTEQTGCILDIFGHCAHRRSYKYFAESINDNKFYAQNCASYKEYKEGTCTGNYSLMAGYSIDREASGNYYLETNNQSPYARGKH